MGTFRQKKLAKALIENAKRDIPMNKGELLEKVGYAKNTAEAKPGEILEQKGVQEELRAYGFDEESAKRVVKEVMGEKTEPNARLKAADMVFKVHGSYAPEKKELSGEVKTGESYSPEVIAEAKRLLKDKLIQNE